MSHLSRLRTSIAIIVAALVAPLILAPAPASSAPAPRSFTIAAGGDVLIHRRIAQVAHTGGGAYDFSTMFSAVEPWISVADLAICHLEVTLTPTNTGLAFYPLFVAPHEVADAIAGAGYDTCSTAGNHALDGGWRGVEETLAILDAAGVRHDGTARNPDERLPGMYDVSGVPVAHISYTYGTNGRPIPADHPYAVNLIDADAILADAAWATAHGAQFVIVSLHWGLEGVVTPTGSQSALAEMLLASPNIDLILGSHAHVVQPIGEMNGKYVVYGMGNQLSNQNGASGPEHFSTEDGLLVLVRVTETASGAFAVSRIDVVPTWVRRSDYRILPVRAALVEGEEAPSWALETSLQRTLGRVRALGATRIRLAPIPMPGRPCHCRSPVWDGSIRRDRIPLVE